RRSNRKAIDARPFTRPDSFASRTDPVTAAPDGTAVTPSTTMALVSVPRTRSSTWLVSDASGVLNLTLMVVPDGMVTSRIAGFSGAAALSGARALSGAAAFASVAGAFGASAAAAFAGSDAAGAGAVAA